jgi:hypothetical protein
VVSWFLFLGGVRSDDTTPFFLLIRSLKLTLTHLPRLGLLLLSGAPCGGICGPRHRWEEEAHEKSTAAYADDLSADEPLPWRWREETAARVRGAWEFCLSGHPGAHVAHGKREVRSLSPTW